MLACIFCHALILDDPLDDLVIIANVVAAECCYPDMRKIQLWYILERRDSTLPQR